MNKKVLVGLGILFVVLFSYFFIFSGENKEKTNPFKPKPKKVVVQNNSQTKIKDIDIKKVGETETVMNVIEQVLKNKDEIGEYEIKAQKGEYLNQSKLSKLKVLVVFLDNSTEQDIYVNIVFKKNINGKYFVGYYYEADDDLNHIVFAKSKEDIEKYFALIKQEEENEKNRNDCPTCNIM